MNSGKPLKGQEPYTMAEAREKEIRAATPLDTLTGKLGNSFSVATDLTRLHRQIIDSQPENNRSQTGAALAAFYAAAEKLQSREAEFNSRPRDAKADIAPDLKINLRSADHFAALREFKGASADIMAINPDLGAALVKTVEKNISAPKQKHGM